MIEFLDVSKSYGKQLVLKKLNFKFSAGQFVALLGRNGSGKSTMLRILARRELITAGDVQFEGQSFKNPSLLTGDRVAHISEDQVLPWDPSLDEWAEFHRSQNARFDVAVYRRMGKDLGIEGEKSFSDLSRGQKAKALFALEAAKRPTVYLLDEITSVLDSGSRLVLMNFLKAEAARGCLVIMSTNVAAEMHGFAGQVIFLEEQVVALACKTEDLSKVFVKFRTRDSKPVKVEGARRVALNSDGTWSYVVRKDPVPYLEGVTLDDRRQVTIEDAAIYFSNVEQLA